MTWRDVIGELRPCVEAVEWMGTQPDYETAWRVCHRGDWMLWLLGKLAGPPGDDSRRPLALAACACARLALPYVQAGEVRPLKAIEAAEDWARGGATTLAQVKAAADVAAAYTAAYTAAAAYARATTLSQCADLVRQHYPEPPRLACAPRPQGDRREAGKE